MDGCRLLFLIRILSVFFVIYIYTWKTNLGEDNLILLFICFTMSVAKCSMGDCLFCRFISWEEKSWKVYEDDFVYAFFDFNPANAYHTLVVPKDHYENIFDIPEDELYKVMSAVKKIALIYKQKLGIVNVQIINSSGADAQQEVFHIHFHIVPREKWDNQDILWTPRIEVREKFDQLITDLQETGEQP